MTDTATTKAIQWNDDFLIGIEELDYEHRMLITDINRLHRQLGEHGDGDGAKGTLGDLHARMQAHFALEEHVMLENEYPHYIEHKAEHNRLLDEYTAFMVDYDDQGDTPGYLRSEELLSRWIVDHIMGSDKKMSLMLG